jgi:tetratricopeptide (TPR) repeat protein
MNDYSDTILSYRSGEMTIAEREEFNRNYAANMQIRKEFIFQDILDKVMKKNLLLEAIESDPDLIKAEILARHDIDNYLNNRGVMITQEEFRILEVETEVELRKKIAKAEVEMVLSGIDDISEIWAKDYERRKPDLQKSADSRQIIEYIQNSEPFNEKVIEMPETGRRLTRKIVFQVAAAVLVLSLLLFKTLIPGYSGDSVYTRNYEPLEANSFQLRGNSQSDNGKLQEGVDFYLSKDFGKAELAFNDLRKMNKNLPEVLLFSGLNQMEQNNFPAAINYFNELLSGEVQFVPETQWYLGLCYLKTGDLQKARTLMTVVSETEGIYKKKALLILKTLNR